MNRFFSLLLLLFLFSNSSFSDTTKLKGKARVLEFKPPYQLMKVDMIGLEKNFSQVFVINSASVLFNNYNELMSANKIRCGDIIWVSAENQNDKTILKSLKLIKPILGAQIKVSGRFDNYLPKKDCGIVGGSEVKLETNTKIVQKINKNNFKTSFKELKKGYLVDAIGQKKTDGILYANTATYIEDKLSETDKNFIYTLSSDVTSSLMKSNAKLNEQTKFLDTATYIWFGNEKCKVIKDKFVTDYITAVGNRLLQGYQDDIEEGDSSKIKFRYIVVDKPFLNLFALPDGLIIISNGILQIINNEAQFATILAHELTHTIYKHALLRLQRRNKEPLKLRAAKFINTLARKSIVFQNFEIDTDIIKIELRDEIQTFKGSTFDFNKAVKTVVYNNYSSDLEEQADRVGLYYMHNAGYNVNEASSVWQKLMELSNNSVDDKKDKRKRQDKIVREMLNDDSDIGELLLSNMLENNFSDHPKTVKRYRTINKTIAENYSEIDFSTARINEKQYLDMVMRLSVIPK